MKGVSNDLLLGNLEVLQQLLGHKLHTYIQFSKSIENNSLVNVVDSILLKTSPKHLS